jgi:diguanylate cyclase
MGPQACDNDPTVLLVEDSRAAARLISEYLLNALPAAKIRHATSMAEAIALLHEETFDTIITDLSLPDSQGLGAVVRLRASAPNAALLVCSALEDEEMVVEAIQVGAQDFLGKDQLDSRTFFRAFRLARERKRAEQRLAHLAFFDSLTGLANRRTFHDQLDRALSRSRRTGGKTAVLYVDLDGFKAVNDDLGHQAGDRVLCEIGKRMMRVFREYDTVARLGGDEFAVLVSDADPALDLMGLARRLISAVAEPIDIDGVPAFVTASLGVSVFPHSASAAKELIDSADRAMNRAKRSGKNQVVLAPALESEPESNDPASVTRRTTVSLAAQKAPAQVEALESF